MKYNLFDTHAHYTDKRFETEFDGGADALICALFENEVEGIVNVAANYENSLEVIAQSKKYEKMYCAVGIHPTDANDCVDIDLEMSRLEALLKNKSENKIVAVGEIGFDYYWEPYDKNKQAEYFCRQMQLAEKYGLPVIIHDREAHGDTFDMIMAHTNVKGILHSCSMSGEMVRQLVKTGNWYISFSGTVTFKNAARVKEAAAAVPLGRLLSETDCPYLAPHPHRGKLNHTGLMKHTVEILAEIHAVGEDEMRQILIQNARNVYNIL